MNRVIHFLNTWQPSLAFSLFCPKQSTEKDSIGLSSLHSTSSRRGTLPASIGRVTLKVIALLPLLTALTLATLQSVQASIIFDDFNVNEGHFTANPPTGSGSSINIANSSTADRVTTGGPLEGAGHQKIVLNSTNTANAMRLRHLSGSGTPANNTAFTTSAGVDGWIGVYVKADATNDPNWTVQFYIEGASTNGSIPKTIICDGTYHLYEWNLDDNSGGPNGWGTVVNIITGSATILNGSHTIDSIVFRNTSGPASTTFYMDFVAKSDSGSISNMLAAPCLATTGVLVTGPVSTNSNLVTVTGVSSNATKVTVYQDSGSGMVAIGSKTNGITAGNNDVTVSSLIKNAQVAGTQTVSGQESCVPSTGIVVGTGANPSIRVALSLRETSSTGPVGGPGNTGNSAIHFLGASSVSGGAPIDAPIVYPSNQWQTLTFQTGLETIADSANASGAVTDGSGYAANETASIQVFAFRTYHSVKIYSANPAQSIDVSSNDVFNVSWTWDAVPGAQGYRLLRNHNGAGFTEFIDAVTNSYIDSNTGWAAGTTVTPTNTPTTSPSIQWNPSIGNANNISTPWAILEAIAFVINVPDGTGPYDIYIDNLKNGTNVFQDFEAVVSGQQDYGFRQPSFSGTTSGSILSNPNVGMVANAAADTGSKSFHLQFQWSGTNANKWLRLSTSGVGDPLVNLSDPITLRILLLPVGSTPTAPPGPLLSITPSGADSVLNWSGIHNLQMAPVVTGTYTNIPGVTNAPYTDPNVATNSARFFRLVN